MTGVIGRVGERKPLVLDGQWLYPERMRVLEERFCKRVREHISREPTSDPRAFARALAAVVAGPPQLTGEQGRAVRRAMGTTLACITGGPGTGKTTIVVALLRALAWLGVPMAHVAIAAPTGKAAQRLREAIVAGFLATASRDIAEAALPGMAPAPQTLHRLLGWSPATGRFARHENDPLQQRVVVVDEASMVDLSMMDRLLRALRPDARLILLGDTHQLPSIEAGAVFRDLCTGLGAARLTVNLRVASDPSAQRIVSAAHAVNLGRLDARFSDVVAVHRSPAALTFTGVEHLAARWKDVGEQLIERWWTERVNSLDDFARRAARTYRLEHGSFVDEDRAELRILFNHHARYRMLCATRVQRATSAEVVNDRLLAKLGSGRSTRGRNESPRFAPGAPVVVERNDYERQLFNGDQGLAVLVRKGATGEDELMAVFPQGDGFCAFEVAAIDQLAPSFAMTVHKAQGSEFDHVGIVLPDADLPVVTRELIYTAMTRARRYVLIVGEEELLARAVSRSVQRHSGIAERLK